MMTPTPFALVRALGAVLMLSCSILDAAAAELPYYPTGDHYLCSRARAAAGSAEFEPRRSVTLMSRFTSLGSHALRKFDVKKPTALCEPIMGGGYFHRRSVFLEDYAIRASKTKPRQDRFVPQTTSVLSPFFDGTLDVKSPTTLLMPTAYYYDYPTGLAPMQCYDVVPAAGTPKPRTQRLAATDGDFQTIHVEVKMPSRLCVPASRDEMMSETLGRQDGLVCHRARLARTRPPQQIPPQEIETRNDFGRETLRVMAVTEVCTRAVVGTGEPPANCPVPTPSVTPTPTTAPTAADRLSLQRITLTPPQIARLPGESKHFIATGHFPGGITQDLSQELTYTSSDPSVAVAPNEAGDRNRIDLLTKGTVTISATDPLTGLGTTDTGDDATLISTGPLQSIVISPFASSRQVCSYQQFQATGIYEDGVERNITQNVIWSTANPFVASAPNTVGDRSRVNALSLGFSHVSATEPLSGIRSGCCPFISVYGALEAIFITPANGSQYNFSPARAPAERRIEARGRYAGGFSKDLMSGIVFNSSDPSVVMPDPSDLGLLRAVGSGTVQITATDLATGVTSPPLSLRSLANLLRVQIPSGWSYGGAGTSQRPVVDVGARIFLSVNAYYGDGIGPLNGPYHFVSSDPTIVVGEQDRYSAWVQALKPGTVLVSVVDELTGITSGPADSIEVHVRGPIERLTIEPATRLRLIGHEEQYSVVAHYQGGTSAPITQRAQFTSSDPTVAQFSHPWREGVASALATGTTTISAFDPESGTSTTDSGADATLTVLKPLERLMVKPVGATRAPGRSYFYTAIGRDVDGVEINLTQDVEWSSSDPSVAVVPYPLNARSRIDTVAAGTTVISAKEPLSGITSSAFGGDAILDVIGPIQRLRVTSLVTTFTVGQSWQLTTTGEDGNGGTTNLTQEVTYTSSHPSIVEATNETDHKSRIVAKAPGIATLSATDPITGKKSSDTGDDIVITVTD